MDKIRQYTPQILSKYFDVAIGEPGTEDFKTMYPIADRFSRWFSKLQYQMAKQANECNNLTGSKAVLRKRRDNEERGIFDDGQHVGPIADFWSIFFHHAAFIRESLIQNPACNQNVAMKMLRRVDRYRLTLIWNYCRKIEPESTHKECNWIAKHKDGSKRKHPRKWADLQPGGKYSIDGLEA